jgi:hypothetical protein
MTQSNPNEQSVELNRTSLYWGLLLIFVLAVLFSLLLSLKMAMTPVASSSPVSTCRLFRCNLLPDLLPKPLFLSLPKRNRIASCRFTVRASANATVESPNGVPASTSDTDTETDTTSYGRQFFPLAAVVGQVREFAI